MADWSVRYRNTSLRTKLVGVVLALMTVAFLAVALATTLALRHFLFGQLDQRLHAASERFVVQLDESGGDSDADNSREQFEQVAGQAAGTLGARVRDGRVVAAAVVGRAPDRAHRVDAGERAGIAGLRPGPPRTVHFHDLGEYRVLTVRRGGELLVTGLPVDPVDGTVHRLIGIELVVYAVALVLVGVAGFSLVRLTLRPLDRITETASRVATLPLNAGRVELAPEQDIDHPQTEVGTLAAAFDQMLLNVEQSLAARQASEERLRRFLSDASHELRTPVAVVRAHAELARRSSEPLPGDVDHALERIVDESGRMGRMVEDLLLLARLNSGRPLEREPVDLTRIVLDSVSDARVAGADHRWRLELPDEPVELPGDEHALRQVLANLLANARVHTPPGTTVTTSLAQRDAAVTLTVADDGPGIPADVQPDVFERFVRADELRSTTSGGSGLGLAIVDAIVRGHGGSTEVHSEPGDTRFMVTLPA
jgi:two-component system OmpR family sensor kinase